MPSTPTAIGASGGTDSGCARTATTGHLLRTASVPQTEPKTSSANSPEPSLPSTTMVADSAWRHSTPTGLPGSMCVLTSTSGAIRCTSVGSVRDQRRGSACRTASSMAGTMPGSITAAA